MNDARRPTSLVERISARVPDRLQGLRVRLGAVPWRTFVLHYRWTGGEVGRGRPELVLATELTPSPMVLGEGDLRQAPMEAGGDTQGGVRFTRISPRYTEDELNLFALDLPAGEEKFLEVVHDGRDGMAPKRRAYALTSLPERNPTTGEWTLKATLTTDSRERYGERRYWADE